MSKNIINLSAEVSKKYEVVGLTGGNVQHFGPTFGVIDFPKMTLKRADFLYKKGFKPLRLRSKSEKASAPPLQMKK